MGLRLFAGAGPDAFATNERMVISGGRQGCVERRALPKLRGRDGKPACEFDGKISLVAHRGKLILYARANLSPRGGARSVQAVARPAPSNAEDLAKDLWGAFRPLQIFGLAGPAARAANVYFFAVDANPVDSETLLGLAPVTLGLKGFIGLSLSCDGLRWSRPEPLVDSRLAKGGRTADHPVDGVLRSGDEVYFFVHQNVPDLAPTGSRLARLTVPAPALAAWSAAAKGALSAHGWCGDGDAWVGPPA